MASKANLKKLKKESRLYLDQVEKLRKKHAKRLHVEAKEAVDSAIGELRDASQGDDIEGLEAALKKMDSVSDRYLGHLRKSPFREYVEAIGLAVVFALFLRAFLIEAFIIPSASMLPTLQEGDKLFVNKFIYGLRIPMTTTRFVDFGLPERGDVVVFVFPREEAKAHVKTLSPLRRACVDQASLREEKDYIKRVVGLPGDKLKMVNNQVFINGKPIAREILDKKGRRLAVQQRETLDDGSSFYTQHDGIDSNFAINKEVEIKPGHVFVMGDNRDNSSDSRCWGQVPVSNIKGKAMVIWFASSRQGVHWDRIGKWIE